VAQTQPAQSSVREFIRDRNHSFQELATSYDASAVPQLAEILNSPADEQYWSQSAVMLGAVGDERAVDTLIMFIQHPVPGGVLSMEESRARGRAIRSLGYIVNRTGSERALQYLIDSLTPSVWRQRNVQGIPPYVTSSIEYDRLLSQYAIMGLAESGTPRAREALKSLQQSPSSGQAQFRIGLDEMLTSWLEVHQVVADRGIAGMYAYYDEKRRAKAVEEAKQHQLEAGAQQPQ
jgi:HEAT repeat protein